MSNGLDPDQDGHSVGPDVGPNCLQRFPADDQQGKSKRVTLYVLDMFHYLLWASLFIVENMNMVNMI